MFASLVIALVAIGVAVGAWFRPLPDNKPAPAPSFTEQQVADAKANVCAAFAKVHHGVVLAGARNGGSDPTAVIAVVTSTRQALAVGSIYLLSKLDEEPATPTDLAGAVRKLANVFQELAIDYLAEASDSETEPSLRTGDNTTLTIERLCK